MRQVQNRITQYNQQLFVLAFEYSRQRLFARFDDDAFSHPLPELCLSGPELFTVTTNDQRCLLFALLLPDA